MSPLVRSFLGGILGLVFILFIQGYLVRNANKNKQGKRLTLFDVIVTSEDNRYSLSRFQIYIWTVWVAIAFVAAVFYEGYLPDIPENLGILMGINGLTTVLASALPKKTDSQEKPSFFIQIYSSTETERSTCRELRCLSGRS